MDGAIEKVIGRLRRKLIKGPSVSSENTRNNSDNCSVVSGGHSVAPDTGRSESFTIEELVRILTEQDKEVRSMKEKLQIVSEKNSKLEQLVAIKDKKLELLQSRKGAG